jgi:hypothetical protein
MNTYKSIVHPSTHIHFSSWFVDNMKMLDDVPQHPPTFVFLLCCAIPRTPYHPWHDLILDRTSPEPKKSLPKAQNYQRHLILDILRVLGTSSTCPKKKGWWHPNVYHTQNLNYNNWVDHKSCQPTNSTTWSYKHVCFLGVSSTWIPKVMMTWNYGSYLHPQNWIYFYSSLTSIQ